MVGHGCRRKRGVYGLKAASLTTEVTTAITPTAISASSTAGRGCNGPGGASVAKRRLGCQGEAANPYAGRCCCCCPSATRQSTTISSTSQVDFGTAWSDSNKRHNPDQASCRAWSDCCRASPDGKHLRSGKASCPACTLLELDLCAPCHPPPRNRTLLSSCTAAASRRCNSCVMM